jgi:protein-S-isoprenylcysteine O-methyltransferase Ste14
MGIRMKNEEEILEKGLDGYIQYKEKVKYKIIPFLW